MFLWPAPVISGYSQGHWVSGMTYLWLTFTYSVFSPAGAAAGLVRLEQEHQDNLQPGLSGMSENEFCKIYL